MSSKKDVEQMNLFELMNEVERLHSKDKTEQLRSEVFQLKHELRRAQATIARLQKSIDFIMHGDKSTPSSRQLPDRRTQPQGRRKPLDRMDRAT